MAAALMWAVRRQAAGPTQLSTTPDADNANPRSKASNADQRYRHLGRPGSLD